MNVVVNGIRSDAPRAGWCNLPLNGVWRSGGVSQRFLHSLEVAALDGQDCQYERPVHDVKLARYDLCG